MRNQQAIDWAWEVEIVRLQDQPAASTQRYVLMALAGYAAPDWLAYPAISTLAERTGLTTRTIKSALHALNSNGLLQALPRPRDTTCYLLMGERPSPKEVTTVLGERPSPLRPNGFTRGWDARGKHEEKKRTQHDKQDMPF